VILGGGTLSATSTFSLAATRGLTLTAASTIDVASGATLTDTTAIAGAYDLTKTGGGILTLTAPAALAGNLNINAGRVTLAMPGNAVGFAPVVSGNVTLGNGTNAVELFMGTDGSTSATRTQELNGANVLTFANGGYTAILDVRGSVQAVRGLASAATNAGSLIQNTGVQGALRLVSQAGDDYTYVGAFRSSPGVLNLFSSGLGTQRFLAPAGAGLAETFGQIAVYSGTVSMGGMASLGASSVVIDPKGVFQLEGTNNVNFPLPLVGGGLFNVTTTGVVTLNAAAGNFGGAITDSAGTLRVVNNAALGGTGSNVTISNGATLDVFGNNATVNKQFVVSGTGVGGLGAIVNSSTTAATNFIRNLRLAGDTTIGGANRFDLFDQGSGNYGLLDMGGYTLTKTGAGFVKISYVAPVANVGNIVINSGQLSIEATTDLGQSTGKTITINNGGQLNFYSTVARNNAGIIINDGGTLFNQNANMIWYGNVTGNVGTSIINTGGNATGNDIKIAGSLIGAGTVAKTGNSYLFILGDSSTFTGTLRADQANTIIGRYYVDPNENQTATNTAGTLGATATAFVNGGNIILSRTDDITFGSAIGGNLGIFYQGSQAWAVPVVGGKVTYTGAVTLQNAATLQVNNGLAEFAAGTVAGTANYSLQINQPGAVNATGAYANPQAWLASNKIATGSTGSLALTGDSSQNLNFAGYTTLMLGASVDSVYSGVLTPAGNTYVLGGGGAKLTVASNLTGPNNLSVGARSGFYSSQGSVVLTGTNTFTGTTTISGGTLTFGANALSAAADQITINDAGALVATGAYNGLAAWINAGRIATGSAGTLALAADSADTFDLNSTGYANLMIGASSPAALNSLTNNFTPGSNGYRFGGGGSVLTVNTVLANSNNVTIGNTTGSVGTVVLAGFNSYTGTTTVNQGILKLAHPSALGSVAGSTVVTQGGTIDLNGQSTAENFTSIVGIGQGGQGAIVNTSATVAQLQGNISGGQSFTVGGTGDIIFSPVTGGGTITKIGSNTLTLSDQTGTQADNNGLALRVNGGTVILAKNSGGAYHAFGNNSYVNAGGTLKLGGAGGDQIYDSALVYTDGGVFDLAGLNETIGGLANTTPSLAGSVTNSAATTATLTLGGNNIGSAVYFGLIADGVGKVAVSKTGTGTITLAG
ncbi:MAG: hypothetical protein EBR62_06860, partial [Verrucomicrobia bacterium]|nr:hypothetical protein [Verrucomicrobiota bacterium]